MKRQDTLSLGTNYDGLFSQRTSEKYSNRFHFVKRNVGEVREIQVGVFLLFCRVATLSTQEERTSHLLSQSKSLPSTYTKKRRGLGLKFFELELTTLIEKCPRKLIFDSVGVQICDKSGC